MQHLINLSMPTVSHPLDREAAADIKDKWLLIDIENHIDQNLKETNGTGIGMKTCEKIIDNGKLSVTKTDDMYYVHIELSI